jgi:acetamidase/formamidase
MDHHLDASQMQYEWNNAIPPRLEIDPGDTVVLETRDAADRYYSRTSTHSDVLARGPFRGHPLTGPVRVRGARPGDALVVEILEVKPADFGWTAIRPGRGLLPEAEFA